MSGQEGFMYNASEMRLVRLMSSLARIFTLIIFATMTTLLLSAHAARPGAVLSWCTDTNSRDSRQTCSKRNLKNQRQGWRPAWHRTKSPGHCIEPEIHFLSTTGARQPCLLSPMLSLPWSPAWARKPRLGPKKKPTEFEFSPCPGFQARTLHLYQTLLSSSIDVIKICSEGQIPPFLARSNLLQNKN